MRVKLLVIAVVSTAFTGSFGLAACSSASEHSAPAQGHSTSTSASASAKAAGTESWEVVSTSISGVSAPIIFGGVFTAGGTGYNGQYTNKVVLPGGTFILDHHGGTGKQSLDPNTCLETITGSGPYTFRNGTGRYAGIRGHGNLTLNIKFVLPRIASKCSTAQQPLAYIEIDSGQGTVSLSR